MAEITTDVQVAADYLMRDELVAIPTETVYGLAANAFSDMAVAKIFAAKNRPTFNPLIVHADSIEKVKTFVQDIPEQAEILMNAFWPGPLTLILNKKAIVPDLVTGGLATVGVRVPNHPLTLDLLKRLDFPLAAPSANPFKYISPTSAAHVKDKLNDVVSCILDGGDSKIGIESTIIGFPDGIPTIYRDGGISAEEIEQHVGPVQHKVSSEEIHAPGMLKKHYSPSKRLILADEVFEMASFYRDKKICVISFRPMNHPGAHVCNLVLSHTGSLQEAASNIYRILRQADNTDAELIIAERLPESGLGKAINDRLTRAAFSEENS